MEKLDLISSHVTCRDGKYYVTHAIYGEVQVLSILSKDTILVTNTYLISLAVEAKAKYSGKEFDSKKYSDYLKNKLKPTASISRDSLI